MALIRIDRDPPRRQTRSFAALWLPGFLVLVGVVLWRRYHSVPLAATLAAVAALSVVVGLALPAAARALFRGATYATFPLAWLVGHLLVAVIFYLVLTPIGVIGRLLGYDPLKRRFDPQAQSYWLERDAAAGDDDYFRQY